MIKIVVLDRTSVGEDVSVDGFLAFGEVDFYESTADADVAERVKDADIIVSNKNPIREETIGGAERLKLVCQFATGYDNVDTEYCRSRGIRVVNVRDYSTAAVVQHTVALVLGVLEKISYYDNYVRSGAYASQPRFSHFGRPYYELDGKVWGIVGLGNIGRSVARVAEALGCHVIYYSASGKNRNEVYERVEWEDLLAQSDIITLHCPLTEQTRGLIDKAALQRMKPEAILVNVARGAVVNEQDLYEALLEDQIGGAGIDVFSEEPIRKDHPLLRIADSGKLLLTPHMAWASTEARTRCVEETCRNIEAFLHGRERNVVV